MWYVVMYKLGNKWYKGTITKSYDEAFSYMEWQNGMGIENKLCRE